MELLIDQQQHGYRNGHQLLASSIKLSSDDQDAVDRLSDMAGPLRPGETFSPYLTAYPLPSGKYYVLARTWQDLAAPRSGCVLTRSLIVPITVWDTLRPLPSLLRLLRPIDRVIESEDKSRLMFVPQTEPLPQVHDARTSQLVEALFLENRQPIVLFDVPEAELITIRLLTAFWPALRRSFCASTFALAPRTYAGKPFDLLFAPKTARSRFSEWDGRKIEPGAPTQPRHRWTAITVERIFRSDEPNLVSADALGTLKFDERGDGSVLRLSLLWNELLSQLESSPNAILGMLDILSSQELLSRSTLHQLAPAIERSIDLAAQSLPALERWEFFITLMDKFPHGVPPRSIRRKIRDSAIALASSEPASAMMFLSHRDTVDRPIPSRLLRALAQGIGLIPSFEAIASETEQLSPSTMLRLLGSDPQFASRILEAAMSPSSRLVQLLEANLESSPPRLRATARRTLLPNIKDPRHSGILAALLKAISPTALKYAVHNIWQSTRFEVEEFDEAILSAARGEELTTALHSAITAVEATVASDRLLLKSLRPINTHIDWLCNSGAVEPSRGRRLLTSLLVQADHEALVGIGANRSTASVVRNCLLQDIPQSATALARFLVHGRPSVRDTLDVGAKVLPHITGRLRSDLLTGILSRGLEEAEPSQDKTLQHTINSSAGAIHPDQLIVLATSTRASGSRLSSNLILLSAAEERVRSSVLARIDSLSHRLINTKVALHPLGINAWASLLESAGSVNRSAQLRAAEEVLPYALRALNAPTSALIVVAFPIVYGVLREGKVTPNLLDLFFFIDWDRCKVARRDLVNSFMRSSWPPGDLLLAASRAGDTQRILTRVVREPKGTRYLRAVEEDLGRFPTTTRESLEAELEKFRGALLSASAED